MPFDIPPIDVKGSGSLLTVFSEHKKRREVQVKSDAPPKRWWHNPCQAYQMFDDCRLTCWYPDPETTNVNVTLTLDKPEKISRALIDCEGKLDILEIAVKDGENWKSLVTVEKPGRQQKIPLPATTAQTIRLTFKTSDKQMFRVWEFQLFY